MAGPPGARRRPLTVIWGEVSEKNVEQLERLNRAIFPVRYSPEFYKHVLSAPEGFAKLAYYNDILVGAVCVRKESRSSMTNGTPAPNTITTPADKSRMYIMTLGVLAPYRGRGIGTKLLGLLVDLAENSPQCQDIGEMYLHVHTGNQEAIDFYTNHGFEIGQRIEGYYRRMDPPDCYCLRRVIQGPAPQ